MRTCRPNRGRVGVWRSGAFLGIAVFFLWTPWAQAQDVAEAARQEQARKAAQKGTPKHVYTEEDLKKNKILTRDDEARVAAKKQQQEPSPAPAQQSAEGRPPAEQQAQAESLGEIARRYRKEKQEQLAEEARKKNYTPFQYELAHPAVATPKPEVAPNPEIQSNPSPANLSSSAVGPVAPHRLPQVNSGGKARVSPFQPRPLVVAPPALRVSAAPASPAIAAVPRPAPPVSASRAVENVARAGLQPVVVRTGDSWWKLATRYLGTGSRWTELRALNPGVGGSAELLRVGITVVVPNGNEIQPDRSTVTKRSQIRVNPGDTLWTLARSHLGRGSAWACLASLNPTIVNYERMAVGTTLQLPDGDLTAACGNVRVSLKN